jgi:basic membrane protein A
MIKDVDVAVHRAIKAALDGTFEGGVKTLGLAEGAVSFVYDDNNRALIEDVTLEQIQHLKEKIISGEIIVPSS